MMDNNSDNAGLTAAEIRKFKTLLLTKRNEILGNVLSMEDDTLQRQRSVLSNTPIHLPDAESNNYEIEHTLGLMDCERKLMREIDEALDRMENGTYGICEGSSKSIPRARLEAIPWAKYCVEYASMLEKGLVKKDFSSLDTSYDYGDDDQDDDSRSTFRRAVG
ncbi:MAG: TraR/DksA C4-type zinc finger protein [Sedimentisphaerales bacterium]|nr:TraR/DksA C4-type zinc finger protein [Sedimentisphaerales bacterium]